MAGKQKMVYVGGLDHSITEEILYAAFIPFGDIREVNLPRENGNKQLRGFGFVDFEEPEDAQAAIDNMNGAELLGRFIKCTFAKASMKLKPGQAVWTTEEYFQSMVGEEAAGEGGEGNGNE